LKQPSSAARCPKLSQLKSSSSADKWKLHDWPAQAWYAD